MIVGWLSLASDISGILNPQVTGVANFAHLGGFFAIIILAFFLSRKDKKKLYRGLVINILTLAIALIAWSFYKMGF